MIPETIVRNGIEIYNSIHGVSEQYPIIAQFNFMNMREIRIHQTNRDVANSIYQTVAIWHIKPKA